MRTRSDVMEPKPLNERLATLRETARDRAERVRERIEWVQERQRELWSRQDRECGPPHRAPDFEAPAVRPAAPAFRAVQPREERRPRAVPVPTLAPRPAEMLLAQLRDMLLEAAAAVEESGAMDDRPAPRELVSAER